MEIDSFISEKAESKTVVRLVTSSWRSNKGIHIKKDIIFLRRQCEGYNVIEEDCSMIGSDEVYCRIINLDECQDGIYQIITCNESRDWESGDIADYDYKLLTIK